MFLMRILFVLLLISLGVCAGVYFLTGDKRYLRFGWQLLKFGLVLAMLAAVIFAMGRIILL